jgi:hypothetical protein
VGRIDVERALSGHSAKGQLGRCTLLCVPIGAGALCPPEASNPRPGVVPGQGNMDMPGAAIGARGDTIAAACSLLDGAAQAACLDTAGKKTGKNLVSHRLWLRPA